ncbi:MAG: IclR family transcriptional regulator [Desulfotomaculum sp.]|nr:IclR family transcriptional regulator [Desulfotomaculum sp.]
MGVGQRGNIVQSLDRALSILEELSRHDSGLGVTDISSVLGLHKSTVYRLLHTLMIRGYVEKIVSTEKYRLGLKIIELGQKRLESTEIRSEARHYLVKLMEETNETVHLCVLDNREVVYIDKVESSNTVRMYSRIGRRAPLYCTGVGKAILAFWPEEEIKKYVKEKGLSRKTDNTITELNQLLKHLEEVRQKGYAVDNEEHDPGIRCVAAPVQDYTGNVVASISVSGPTTRIAEDQVKLLAAKVKKCALNISKQLGYNP